MLCSAGFDSLQFAEGGTAVGAATQPLRRSDDVQKISTSRFESEDMTIVLAV